MPIISNFPTSEDVATKTHDGLMSAADKTKLDGIANGATANTGTVTSVTLTQGNGITVSSSGTAITGSGTRTISVNYGTDAPKMDGTAAAGSSATPAHSDHIHPTDTSRAAASDLTSHTGNKSNPHGVTAAQAKALPEDGTAVAAAKLANAQNIRVNLASESNASFNGTAAATPGVDGILPVKHGGTGVDNLNDLKSMLEFGVPVSKLGVSSVLNDNSWANIKKMSDLGFGANIWSIGDTKSVLINGTIGTLHVNATVWVYILGFNHNSDIEGEGITFGGFKTAQTGGTDVCLVDSKYSSTSSDGTLLFNLNHWGTSSSPYNTSYGGWKGCDARYDILGSTNKEPSGYKATPVASSRVGYDPENYDIVNSPVANTLMAALPSELRAVMKPITKYTDNNGNSSNVLANVTTSVDYLPLLAEYEIFGARTYANQYEQNYQRQYAYYAAGNSKVKYCHSSTGSAAIWWGRSPGCLYTNVFCAVSTNSVVIGYQSRSSYGLAPAFMV